MNSSGVLEPRQQAALRVLLQGLGRSSVASLTPLAGGANNRVFRVDTDGSPVLLKVYFRHPRDPRDRLGAEFAFCRFAWDSGVQVPPQPLAADADASLALYEFIEGERVRPGQVSRREVQAALDFYSALNRHRDQADALPAASEACFGVGEHLQMLQRRLGRLSEVRDARASAFIADQLLPTARRVLDQVSRQLGEGPLAATDRRVSPCDFGFHNALRQADGRLRFIDFEYAGWDDPATAVCVFFCQPTVPVPLACWDLFARGVAADLDDPAAHLARFAALLPVYRLKWCCIVLNDFLPEGSARRRFASGAMATPEHQTAQLAKARAFLSGVQT